MKSVLLIALLALAGCATTSDVMDVGQGNYMVGTSVRGGLTSDTEVKAGVIRRATAYCTAMQKKMELVSSTSSGVQMWTPQNAEVIFRCV